MERTIEGFLAALASPAPAPGGGGAAALTGALGIALGNMVGNLTLGKKKYAAVEEELLALNAEAEKLREELLELIDEDARAFLPLSRAYAIPRDDPERGKIMEEALLRAVRPPMEVMGKCARALELIALYGEKGSALAISDAGCAAALALAAIKAAALNVKINTKSMADRDTALELNGEADRLLALYGRTAEKIYQNITGRLV